MGSLVGFTGNTVSLLTGFFVESGLLTKDDTGRFLPTGVTLEFARAFGWNRDTATIRLAPALQETWFAEALRKRLTIRGSATVKETVEWLADEAKAAPNYQTQVRLLLDYLDAAHIIERDGQVVRLARGEDSEPVLPGFEPPPSEPEVRRPTVTVTQPSSGVGAIDYRFEIHVDMAQLSQWSPERIAAFLNGLAQVVAASQGRDSDMG